MCAHSCFIIGLLLCCDMDELGSVVHRPCTRRSAQRFGSTCETEIEAGIVRFRDGWSVTALIVIKVEEDAMEAVDDDSDKEIKDVFGGDEVRYFDIQTLAVRPVCLCLCNLVNLMPFPLTFIG